MVAECRFLALECPLLKPAYLHLPSGCPAAGRLPAGGGGVLVAEARAPAPPPSVPLPALPPAAVQTCTRSLGALVSVRGQATSHHLTLEGAWTRSWSLPASPDLCQLLEQGGGGRCLPHTRSLLRSSLSTAKLVRPQKPFKGHGDLPLGPGTGDPLTTLGPASFFPIPRRKEHSSYPSPLSKPQAPQRLYHLRFLSTVKQVHSQ